MLKIHGEIKKWNFTHGSEYNSRTPCTASDCIPMSAKDLSLQPLFLMTVLTLTVFRCRLKTYLFSRSFSWLYWPHLWSARAETVHHLGHFILFTYLLTTDVSLVTQNSAWTAYVNRAVVSWLDGHWFSWHLSIRSTGGHWRYSRTQDTYNHLT